MTLQLRKSFYLSFILVIVLVFSMCKGENYKVEAEVWDNLDKNKPLPLIVECRGSDSRDLLPGLRTPSPDEPDKGKAAEDALDEFLEAAAQRLAPLIDLLEKENADYIILPISNSLKIFRPNEPLLNKIKSITIVTRVRLDRLAKTATKPQLDPPTGNTTWNHGLIDDRCKTIKRLGKGVIVGIIDFGVMYNHVELIKNFIGNDNLDYGWFDATVDKTASRFPDDLTGSGTAYLSIAVGKRNGVAPDASWEACRACKDNSCSRSALEICVLYMTCPWKWNDQTRTATRKCSLGAKVVLLARGLESRGQILDPDLYFYYKLVQFWNIMGVIPVFAMGDTGPDCNSAKLPGAFDISLSVGAVNENAVVLDSSSRGPVVVGKRLTEESTAQGMCPALSDRKECTKASNDASICTLIKPDITAPGSNIIVATTVNTTSYDTQSGTGLAAAHTAGVLALMISANPDAKWDHKLAYKILTETADITRIDQQGSRGNGSPDFLAGSHLLCNLILSGICAGFPDNLYGWGILHACNAVKAALKL